MMTTKFTSQSELFKFLKDNKQTLISEKKYKIKEADSICYSAPAFNEKGEVIKSETTTVTDLKKIKVTSVINSTNILDSHGDVHMPNIWNKSVKETKKIYLLQEHQMKFDKIITDKVKVSVKTYDWSELGYPEYPGKTQCLVFESEIDSDRNAYMFDQYLKGYVTNHSVGMQYVNLFLCINSEEKYYREEKENWDKYITEVVNVKDAESNGYFWAVTEAKAIEGSAVPVGSNRATPTISITEADKITSIEIQEPDKATQNKAKKDQLIKFLNN